MSPEKTFDFSSPRQFDILPANNLTRYFKLWRLRDALEDSWNKDTCADKDKDLWSTNLLPFGQCAVTALVVQDLLGGKIVKDPDNDHYWNVMDDGAEVDLTRSQFGIDVKLQAKEERTRESLLTGERAIKARTPERYKILRDRVDIALGIFS